MAKNFKDLVAKLPVEAQQEIDLKAKEAMADMLLAEIRKLSGFSQQDLAKQLGVSQPALSKMESQDDMQISTLMKLVEALGGELQITARFKNHELKIGQFKKFQNVR
jgi:transcriptional regulator with XRE-family HTH domain